MFLVFDTLMHPPREAFLLAVIFDGQAQVASIAFSNSILNLIKHRGIRWGSLLSFQLHILCFGFLISCNMPFQLQIWIN